MANFVLDNTPLPPLKSDANPPVRPEIEVDAADINGLWAALGDVRTALATEQPVNFVAPFTGAVSRTIPSKLGETISVKDFGATGDGTTDDTAAIQNALATGKNTRGVSGETYLVNGGLTTSTAGQVIDFSGCTLTLKSAAASKGILTLSGIGSKVVGGTWDLNVAGNATGSQFAYFAVLLNADRTVAEGMYVKNSYGIGIKASAGVNYAVACFNRVEGSQLVGIYFDGSTTADAVGNAIINNSIDVSLISAQGIYLASASPYTFVHRRWRIQNNEVIGPTAGALAASVGITGRGQDGIVTGNHVLGTNIGISVDISAADESTLISGNRVEGANGGTVAFGIEVNGAKALVQGNIIKGGRVGITASSTGTPSTVLDHLQIVGNHLVEQTVNSIFIAPGTGNTAQHLNISGNTIVSTATAQAGAIRLAGDCRFSLITGNLIRMNGVAGGGVAVYLDTVNSDVSVIGNRLESVQNSVVAFNAAAVAQSTLSFNFNDVSNAVGNLSAALISVAGSATVGSSIQMIGNFRGGGSTFRDDVLDKSNNILFNVSNSFNSPEGAFTAGPGSMYINKNSFKPALWVKESGTGNTGWAGMPVKGKATLVAGTVTVNTSAVTAASPIVLTNDAPGGTPGKLSVGTIVAGTSFVINSDSGTDTSTIAWMLAN